MLTKGHASGHLSLHLRSFRQRGLGGFLECKRDKRGVCLGCGQSLVERDRQRNGGATNYIYDPTSQLSSMQYPNGVAHAFTYDSRDRPTNLAVSGPGGALASYTQAFSDSSHKLSAGEATGRTENYAYDSIYRLMNQNIAGDPGSVNGSLAYSLDSVGNRFSLLSTLAALP